MKKLVLTVVMAISLCVAMATTASNEPCCNGGKCEKDTTAAPDSTAIVAMFNNDTVAPVDTTTSAKIFFAMNDTVAPADTAAAPASALVAMAL